MNRLIIFSRCTYMYHWYIIYFIYKCIYNNKMYAQHLSIYFDRRFLTAVKFIRARVAINVVLTIATPSVSLSISNMIAAATLVCLSTFSCTCIAVLWTFEAFFVLPLSSSYACLLARSSFCLSKFVSTSRAYGKGHYSWYFLLYCEIDMHCTLNVWSRTTVKGKNGKRLKCIDIVNTIDHFPNKPFNCGQ